MWAGCVISFIGRHCQLLFKVCVTPTCLESREDLGEQTGLKNREVCRESRDYYQQIVNAVCCLYLVNDSPSGWKQGTKADKTPGGQASVMCLSSASPPPLYPRFQQSQTVLNLRIMASVFQTALRRASYSLLNPYPPLKMSKDGGSILSARMFFLLTEDLSVVHGLAPLVPFVWSRFCKDGHMHLPFNVSQSILELVLMPGHLGLSLNR